MTRGVLLVYFRNSSQIATPLTARNTLNSITKRIPRYAPQELSSNKPSRGGGAFPVEMRGCSDGRRISRSAEWGRRHQRQFIYATSSMFGGILVAVGLIGGFVYLVMNNHSNAAGGLLGAGVVGIISGFLASRLDQYPG